MLLVNGNNQMMNYTMNAEISILILTHNQKCLLERCLDSILNQIINVPYEIIISDDGIDDGTRQFVQELAYSKRVTSLMNLVELKYVYCNLDESVLKKGGTRIGRNRLNAYMHAHGKYFVNVDADDFLVGTELYQKEYEMLEAHSECSMVQTRLFMLNEGEDIDRIYDGYPNSEKLVSGAVFSLEDVLRYRLRGQHQTYMYRRRPQDDFVRLLGCGFDDINITYYHLQYGPVVFLDIAGYVWVQYPKSDSHSFSVDELRISYSLIPLSLAVRFKDSRDVFLRAGVDVKHLLRKLVRSPKYPELSDGRRKAMSLSDMFIMRFFSEKRHGFYSWSRYFISIVLLSVMWLFRLKSKFWLDIMYRTLV